MHFQQYRDIMLITFTTLAYLCYLCLSLLSDHHRLNNNELKFVYVYVYAMHSRVRSERSVSRS